MPFNFAGGTITQTGTDADLSALATTTGNPPAGTVDIAYTSANTAVGIGKIVYTINNAVFAINGTLSIDPEREILILNGTAVNGNVEIGSVGNTGTFNLGRRGIAPPILGGGAPAPAAGNRVSHGTGLYITWRRTDSQGGFNINGTFNWFGSGIQTGASIICGTGSTINIEDTRLVSGNTQNLQLLRFNAGSTIDVNGLLHTGMGIVLRTDNITRLQGVVPEHVNVNANTASSTGRLPYGVIFYAESTNPTNTPNNFSGFTPATAATFDLPASRTINDFQGVGNIQDVALIDVAYGILRNPVLGNEVTVGGWLTSNNRLNGRVEVRRDFTINAIDATTGQAEQDVNLFIRDVNNNSRQNTWNLDDRPDNTYVATTNRQGTANIDALARIITGVQNTVTSDVRTVGTTGNFELEVYKYGFSKQTITIPTTTAGVNIVAPAILPNINVTEEDETVAGAYTEFTVDTTAGSIAVAGTTATLDRLHDFVEFTVTRPATAGQVALQPTETQFALGPSGGVLGIGNWSLAVNGSLANGTTLSSLDMAGVLITGTVVSGSVENLNISGLGNTQQFNNVTNAELNSQSSNDNYTINGSVNGGVLRGQFTFAAGATTGGNVELDGEVIFLGPTYTLDATMFGDNFRVANTTGTTTITQGTGTDFQTVIAGQTVQQRLQAAGYTVVIPAAPDVLHPVLLNIPAGSSGFAAIRTGGATTHTGTITNGAVTWVGPALDANGNPQFVDGDTDTKIVTYKLNSVLNTRTIYRTRSQSFTTLSGPITIEPLTVNTFFFADNQTENSNISITFAASTTALIQGAFPATAISNPSTNNRDYQSAVILACNSQAYFDWITANEFAIDYVDYQPGAVVMNASVVGLTPPNVNTGIVLVSNSPSNQTIVIDIAGSYTRQTGATQPTVLYVATGIRQVLNQESGVTTLATVTSAVAGSLSAIENKTGFLVENRLGNKGISPYDPDTNYPN